MSFGKLYMHAANPRGAACQAVAKANKLDVQTVHAHPGEKAFPADYQLLNKLSKIPTFEGADGFILTECIAIAIYFASQNEKTSLLGKTKQDYASILRWMSFANSEIVSPLASWFKPLKGMEPYNKKNVTDAQAQTNKVMKVLDEHLLINTYLVGERLTLADVFTAFMVVRGFSNFFDKEWREQHPNVTRWFQTVSQQPIFTDVGFAVSFCDKAIPNQAPPKAEAPKEKKEAAKPKAAAKPAADDDDEDDAPPAPKPKHPLEALPKPTFVLDDLKREYSNKETREEALPWFWEHANFEEYSLWQVDYKYNNELTMTFMTSNLVGGFFTRLEASRKYLFGTGNVFGTTNDSIVRGAFLVRGQDAVPAFDVAPDADSYTFTKLDPKAAGIKEFVNDMWAQDKPITVDGKSYEWADGKVFK